MSRQQVEASMGGRWFKLVLFGAVGAVVMIGAGQGYAFFGGT